MTRENLFVKMTVAKGNHYCMFCDHDANFVITNNNVTPKAEYPMCKKCAELFKLKINDGFNLESR